MTSATAAAYRGHRSGASSVTATPADRRRWQRLRDERLARGSEYAVAASRANPITLRASGLFAVISKSSTASSLTSRSIPTRKLEAAQRQRFAELLGRSGDVHELAEPGKSTNSHSQRKLLQETKIVFVEQPDVIDAVLQHGDALDAHAEREAGVALGVVADGFEDRGVHHAAAADLEPARPLADRAAFALQNTQPMNTSALGSVYGKKLGRNCTFVSVSNSSRANAVSVPFRSAIVMLLADDKPFDLLKHRRVRQVEIVAAVHLARHDDPHRRLVLLHVADLHRRRMRAKQRGRPIRGRRTLPDEVKRVLHVAGRMLRRHIERFEIVVVVFDLGTLEHLIAHAREDRLDLFAHDCQRMAMADRRLAAGERDIDRADGRFRRVERRPALVELLSRSPA